MSHLVAPNPNITNKQKITIYEELVIEFLDCIEEWCLTESFCTFTSNKIRTYGDLIKRLLDICGIVYHGANSAIEKMYEYKAFKEIATIFDEIVEKHGNKIDKFLLKNLDNSIIDNLSYFLTRRSSSLKLELVELDKQTNKEQQVQEIIKKSSYDEIPNICDNIILSKHEHTCASQIKNKKLHAYYYINMMISLLKSEYGNE